MDTEKNRFSRNLLSTKTDVQIKMQKRNKVVFIKTEHTGTYTMAKLTEALEGENSMSEPGQQLAATKHTHA